MKKKSKHHVFLILSDCVNESLLHLYSQIEMTTENLGDTFIVFDNKSGKVEERLLKYKTYEFTNTVMNDLGYVPIRSTLVPGSNHFPILNFYLDNPDYEYYWCIEDDVVFNGEWSFFFINLLIILNLTL